MPHSLKVIVKLTDGERDRLNRPLAGTGGFQSLLRRLQAQLDGSDLTLLPRDLRAIVRLIEAGHYGTGGFQDRLGGVVRAAKRLQEILTD